LIRMVATALVLMVGAAVILWYGNTLNSWVVGGLVGGLGALLLSIPISIVIFAYFAHRWYRPRRRKTITGDMIGFPRRTYAIVQGQVVSLDDEDYFSEDQDLYDEYDDEDADDEYMLAEQSEWAEKWPHHVPPTRYLSAPPTASSARFPIASQGHPSQTRRAYYGADPEQPLPKKRKNASHPTQKATSRKNRTDPSYSRYRSEALRAARVEAALRAEYDDEN
jgi:hypothetical protein